MKFKVEDLVRVTAGKDRGKEGKVEKLFPKEFSLIVAGANMYKKNVKGSQGQKGGIYDIPKPLSFAKIALICPKCKKVTRVSFSVKGEKKQRVCSKCKREIDTK